MALMGSYYILHKHNEKQSVFDQLVFLVFLTQLQIILCLFLSFSSTILLLIQPNTQLIVNEYVIRWNKRKFASTRQFVNSKKEKRNGKKNHYIEHCHSKEKKKTGTNNCHSPCRKFCHKVNFNGSFSRENLLKSNFSCSTFDTPNNTFLLAFLERAFPERI